MVASGCVATLMALSIHHAAMWGMQDIVGGRVYGLSIVKFSKNGASP
jgi:hypothetical protein